MYLTFLLPYSLIKADRFFYFSARSPWTFFFFMSNMVSEQNSAGCEGIYSLISLFYSV